MLYQRRWCYEEQEEKYLRTFTTGPLTTQYSVSERTPLPPLPKIWEKYPKTTSFLIPFLSDGGLDVSKYSRIREQVKRSK